mmetsp:Transcript_144053/g.265702  ORF Transcript_144053/g.265702 Transcript_144053/m.265702 type:complete len:107 (-) Transcript_144053:35-355(-)
MATKGMLGAALYGNADESASAHHAFVSDMASLTHAPRATGTHATFTAFLSDVGSSNHESHEHFLPDASASHAHDGSSAVHIDFLFGQDGQAKRAGLFSAFSDDKDK